MLKNATSFLDSVIMSRKAVTVFWLLVIASVVLRLWQFNSVPFGMHQDEINAGYETWSLIHFGTDRWGNIWPVYFPSWGSGQNVLYSYILMPFMMVFGDSDVIIRVPALLMGILLPILVYLLTKRLFNVQTALIAMFISAFFPDFIRASRWAVESNIVPFMVVLSLYVLVVALQDKKQRWWVVVPALIPLALTVYAYVITIVPVGIFLLVVLVWKRKVVLANWGKWLTSIMIFGVLLVPIVLFLLKTTVFKNAPFSFEQWLPFSLPALEESRYGQITEGSSSLAEVIFTNLTQLVTGNFLGQAGSGPDFVFPLFIFAVVVLILSMAPKTKELFPFNVVSLWCLAAMTLILFVPLSNIRGNLLFVPFIILLSNGLYVLFTEAKLSHQRVFAGALIVGYLLYTSVWFVGYLQKTNDEYNLDFKQALTVASQEANGEADIFLPRENWLQLDYMQVMWYERITPETIADNPVPKKRLENFVFGQPSDSQEGPYYKVMTRMAKELEINSSCKNKTVLYESNKWVVYSCA